MNISTYEARIAALEAQLGPGPSTAIGLLSVMVNPDITLADTTKLNSKIASLMPIEPSAEPVIITKNLPVGTLVADYNYNFSITPSPNWYAVFSIGSQTYISETPGLTYTVGATAVQSGEYVEIHVTAMASETGTPEGSLATLIINLKSPIA